MKRALFDGWLGTDDGKSVLVTPGMELPDDHEVVLGHPAQFEDVPAPAAPAEPDPVPEEPADPAPAAPAPKPTRAAAKTAEK